MFTGDFPQPTESVLRALRLGIAIPAHPLALDARRRYDERAQRALTRYYHAAGAGGVAVGAHTTQFEVRSHGLYEPVLSAASETASALQRRSTGRFVLVAGVSGHTVQAVNEARTARNLAYDAALVSLSGLQRETDDELLAHIERVARELPVFGFYLQPAVGGRLLSYNFWRKFAELPNLVAIKISPFNRYRTLDVARAVAASGRAREIALFTGNDDSIVVDLVMPFEVTGYDGTPVTMRIVGGLLGHWACWTHTSVRVFEECRRAVEFGSDLSPLLALGARITDINGALFDAANDFRGAVAGVNEVLRRQGLLQSALCLDPNCTLSAGQSDEIDRVCREHPHLTDDRFVIEHRDEWLA